MANGNGKVNIQIRDLDQTVMGNPAHDLIRLALSLATGAPSSDLPGVITAEMLEQLMVGYEQGLNAAGKAKTNGATQFPHDITGLCECVCLPIDVGPRPEEYSCYGSPSPIS